MADTYKAKIKHIIVADPVPSVQEKSTPPCGTCRHIIRQFGTPNTSVVCIQYIKLEDGWAFPKIEKHLIKDLYPNPYDPKEGLWD